jgi:hypothetical protein
MEQLDHFHQLDNYGITHRFTLYLCIISSETFQNTLQQSSVMKHSIKFKMCSAFIPIMLYDTIVSACDVNTLFSRQYFLFNKHILVQNYNYHILYTDIESTSGIFPMMKETAYINGLMKECLP